MTGFWTMTLTVFLTGLALILCAEAWTRLDRRVREIRAALRDRARLDWLVSVGGDLRRGTADGVWSVVLPGGTSYALGGGATARQAIDQAMANVSVRYDEATAVIRDLRAKARLG